MQVPTGDAEDVHRVAVVAGKLHERHCPAVLAALLIRVRGRLHHLDARRGAEKLHRRGTPLPLLVLPIHSHEVVCEGAARPAVAGGVPDVAPVGRHLLTEGEVDQPERILVTVAVIGVAIEIECVSAVRIAVSQHGHLPAGKVLGAERKRTIARGGEVRWPVPERVFTATLIERRPLSALQQRGIFGAEVIGEYLRPE